MKNNFELFAVIKEIIVALRDVDENDFALRLEEALSISTVPGEILGEIRLRLQEIPQDTLIALQVEQKVNTALKYLDNIFGW